jgi:hypothetical protein
MVTTQEVASAVIKRLYEGDGAHEQMRDFNPTLKQFETAKDDIEGGSTVYFPLQKQYQQGIGARSEEADLPTPGKSNYIACDFPLKKLCFSVQITTSAWKKSKAKGVAAFVDLLTEQGTDVLGGHYRDMNWQLFGDGSGLRTQVNGAVAGPDDDGVTITVDSTKGLFEGMLVDFYIPGSTTPLQVGAEITGVDNLNLQITVDSIDQAIPDNSGIYRSGNYNNEIMGLGGFVSDTSGPTVMQGITVADQPTWRANDLDNGGTARDLSRDLLDQAMRAGAGVDQRRPDIVICGLVQARKYAQMQVIKDSYDKTDKGGRITLDAGYEFLKVYNRPLIEDPDCPDDRMYFLRTKGVLKMWALGKPEFVRSPDDKGMWYRLAGKPYFRADGEHFLEFGGYRRNNQTVLRDLTTT